MPFYCNLNPSGVLVPPGGYPITLAARYTDRLEAVIPAGRETITAVVAAEAGQVTVYMTLSDTPASSGAVDGVEQERETATVYAERTTVEIELPNEDDEPLTPYIFRMWFDSPTATQKDEEDRNPTAVSSLVFGVAEATYDADPGSYNPRIPRGLTIHSLSVS
jgi:hypothetical protein